MAGFLDLWPKARELLHVHPGIEKLFIVFLNVLVQKY